MLGCIQPMSSPMMNMILGFWSCATALDAGSADAVARAATAVPVDKSVRDKLIGISCVWLALPAQEGFNSPTTHSLGPMVNRARGPLCASAFLSVGATLSQRDTSRVAPGTFGRPKNRGAIRGLPGALD